MVKSGAARQRKVSELAAFSLDGINGRAHQAEVQEITYDEKLTVCRTHWRHVRRLADIQKNEAFEVVWKMYREQKIYT